MARTFRRPHLTRPIAELNVTNLIDLGFTLLIIFMIATPLISQEQAIPVRLPAEAKSPQPRPDRATRFVSITIDARGRYYLEDRPTPVSLDELSRRFSVYATEPNPPVFRIRGDGAASWNQIARLIEELKKANLLKLDIITQPEG